MSETTLYIYHTWQGEIHDSGCTPPPRLPAGESETSGTNGEGYFIPLNPFLGWIVSI